MGHTQDGLSAHKDEPLISALLPKTRRPLGHCTPLNPGPAAVEAPVDVAFRTHHHPLLPVHPHRTLARNSGDRLRLSATTRRVAAAPAIHTKKEAKKGS